MKSYFAGFLFSLVGGIPFVSSQSETVSIIQIEKLLHKKINDYRKNGKLPAYVLDEGLKLSAQNHCDYIFSIQKLTHKQPTGQFQNTVDRIRYFSKRTYMSYGQNCLQAYYVLPTSNSKEIEEIAENMFEMWRNSKMHDNNLMHQNFTHTGFGMRYNSDTHQLYCVMDFGGD